jgi:chemotaxis signal transduction protein
MSMMIPMVLFTLEKREYCMPVADVQAVLRMVNITPLIEPPPNILGVINMHGTAIMVLDLRPRLGLPPLAPSSVSPLLLITTHGAPLAVLVDKVVGVVYAESGDLSLARLDGRLVPVLSANSLPDERVLPLLRRQDSSHIQQTNVARLI